MRLLRRVGLGGRLLAIVVVVVSIDFLVNSVLFESARMFVLREDDAAWMAEHVVVAHRVMDRAAPGERSDIARQLSTDRFSLSWSRYRTPASNMIELSTLHGQMLAAEPDLTIAELRSRLASAGIDSSPAAISRFLTAEGLTRKKRRNTRPSKNGRMAPQRGLSGAINSRH